MGKITKKSRITLVELPGTEFGELLTDENTEGQLSSDLYRYFQLPPRAAPLIAAILMQAGYQDVQIIDPNYHGNNGRLTASNLERIFSSDVLGVPAISRISNQSKELMRRYKTENPDGIGIFGGPHFSARVNDGLKSGNADIVALWEADNTIPELFAELEKDPPHLENILGIAYKDGNETRVNPRRRLLTPEELTQLPQPYYDSAIRKGVKASVVPTSRGCPWDCNFCIVTEMYGKEYRRPSIEHVIESAKQVFDMGKSVLYIDDNLPGESPEDRAYCKELLRRIRAEGLNRMHSIAQFSIHASKDAELLRLAKQAGIDFICVGVESLNDQSLKALNKPARPKTNIDGLRRYADAGLSVHGMKMPGGDGDTSESLDYESELDKQLLHTVQYFPTGPIPGTRFEAQMGRENRLLPIDYAYGTGDFVLVRPKNFTPLALQLKIRDLYDRFYTEEHYQRLKRNPNVDAGGIIIYRNMKKGIRDVLQSPQMQKHLEFLERIG